MTIPEPPLPQLADLLKALASEPVKPEQLVTVPSGYSTHMYRRGSFAMAAAIRAVQLRANASRVVVGLPDYFCNDALHPVRHLPVDLVFYPVKPDLTIDWISAGRLFSVRQPPSVFVLVHYFGFPGETVEAKRFCEQRSMVLMEDAAHCLMLSHSMAAGDFIVFSPRKLLPSPSGGLLAYKSDWAKYVGTAQNSSAKPRVMQWALRRAVQKTLCDIGIPWHFMSSYQNPRATEAVPQNGSGLDDEACDEYGLRLLHVVSSSRHGVIKRRRENYARLANYVAKAKHAELVFSQLPSDVCPYVLPLRVSGDAREIVSAFRKCGIPASRWPDLPPEVVSDSTSHTGAINMYGSIILLPLHQSLDDDDIRKIGLQICAL